jgi:hypothetical protein
MMHFKKVSLMGEQIEWIEESDDEELSAARKSSCRQALNGGSVGASNGIRITVGRKLDDKVIEGDRYLFWLGEGQERAREYLVLGDNMEEAGETEALGRMVGAGKGVMSEKAKKTAEILLAERPVLVSRRVGKALGVKVEAALREVALGVALALGEEIVKD